MLCIGFEPGTKNGKRTQIYCAIFKMGQYRTLFLYSSLFNPVDSEQMFNISFANDWI